MKLNSTLLARAAGLECLDPKQIGRIERYAHLVLEANRKINLVSRSVDPASEIERQIAISLCTMRVIVLHAARWIDIGSGGGFPAIPLAILRPDIDFLSVEPIAKKAYFIERAAQELQIQNLRIKAMTIDGVMSSLAAPQWDVVSIKAVTDLRESFAWSIQLLVEHGLLVTFKPERVDPVNEMGSFSSRFKHKATLDVKELIDTIDLRVVVYQKTVSCT